MLRSIRVARTSLGRAHGILSEITCDQLLIRGMSISRVRARTASCKLKRSAGRSDATGPAIKTVGQHGGRRAAEARAQVGRPYPPRLRKHRSEWRIVHIICSIGWMSVDVCNSTEYKVYYRRDRLVRRYY